MQNIGVKMHTHSYDGEYPPCIGPAYISQPTCLHRGAGVTDCNRWLKF